jgi:hypothetical protein
MCPDHRHHRGAHIEDHRLFAPERLDALRTATGDLAWLLSRGYAMPSSLKLVGDRYNLQERQRTALSRVVCTDQARIHRAQTLRTWDSLHNADVAIDGFNLLITIEAAFGGGLIMQCRDGCLRDLASMYGSYRAVQETTPALELIGSALVSVAPRSVLWLLDSPVSNSGRLAQNLRELAQERGWNWHVETVFDPDAVLKTSERLVISSDSVVLDHAAHWVNAAHHLISGSIPTAWQVDFAFVKPEL